MSNMSKLDEKYINNVYLPNMQFFISFFLYKYINNWRKIKTYDS